MIIELGVWMYVSKISLRDFESVLTIRDDPSGIDGSVSIDSKRPLMHVSASPIVLWRGVVDLLGILIIPLLMTVFVWRFRRTKLPPAVGSSSKK